MILEKRKSGQSWQTSKVYTLQDGAIGYIIAETTLNPSGLTMWYHYDRLGNVMDLTDENGSITASYDQDAFGNVLEGNQSGYHLTTKEYSSNIGLYYFFQRWYEPNLGRFTQKDKVRFLNRYVYVKNSPVKLIDIDGNMPPPDDDGGVCFLYCGAGPNCHSCTNEGGYPPIDGDPNPPTLGTPGVCCIMVASTCVHSFTNEGNGYFSECIVARDEVGDPCDGVYWCIDIDPQKVLDRYKNKGYSNAYLICW